MYADPYWRVDTGCIHHDELAAAADWRVQTLITME
jgi:hypothetical protein